MASVGDRAPDFTLTDQHGQSIALSSVSMPALIVFIPAAFTPVCGGELQALRAVAHHVPVLAVSCDSMYVLRALADVDGLTFALLSDFWPHGEVARAYAAFDDRTGRAQRVSVLVDQEGMIAARWQAPPGQARDAADYLRALGDIASA